MSLAYRIEVTPDDNDTFLVTVPALPEVTTFADGAEEAEMRASDAIEEALAGRIARGEDIPAGEREGVSIPLLSEMKVELYRACKARGVTRADLVRSLHWNRESVDRLFRLDHASKVVQLEEAYRALGLKVRLAIDAAGGGHPVGI